MLTSHLLQNKKHLLSPRVAIMQGLNPNSYREASLLDSKLLRKQSVQLVRKQTKIRTPCMNKITPLRINLGKFPSTKQRE